VELGQKRIKLLICLVIIVATFIAYEPIRHNGFVDYDDNQYITENRTISSGITLHSLNRMFLAHHGMWHPLTTFTNMLDCEFFDLNPFWHHFVSLLIHIADAVLLFWLLTYLTGAIWPSAFVAAVFALHPLQVESVAWASERKNVLSGLFWFLTMLVYAWYTRKPGTSRYLLLVLIYGLCIMTKPTVITLPLVLLLLDYWPLERFNPGRAAERKGVSPGRLLMEKIPLLLLSVFLGAITVFVQQQGGTIVTSDRLPIDVRIANALISYIKYIGKFIWPIALAIIYPHPGKNFSEELLLISFLLFVLISAVCIYLGRRKRYLAVGWLWFVGTLVPTIGLIQAGTQAMANRYMYLPMLGLLFIIAWSVKELVANRSRLKIIMAGSAALLLLCALAITRMNVRYWQNSNTLFEHTLKVIPGNDNAEYQYGLILFRQGRLDDAISHFNSAIRINPALIPPRSEIGFILIKQGKVNEAIDYLNELLRYGDFPRAHYYLGVALMMESKYVEAIKHFRASLIQDPRQPDVLYKMGVALLSTGNPNEAIIAFNKVIKLNPADAETYINLGKAYQQLGRFVPAIEAWSKAAQLSPDNVTVLKSIAFLLVTRENISAQDAEKAISYSRRACELTNYKEAAQIDILAAAFAAAGNFDEAQTTAQKAIDTATAAGQEKLARSIEKRLLLYKQGRRFPPK
jgi:tetratricopeptide (TPR) repeat protein